MHIVIIGNGVAGITAARHIRKRSAHRITVISKESEYFFSRTALMYVYMGHMKFQHIKPYEDWFWKKNKIDLLYDEVKQIDFNLKTVHLSTQKVQYDKLLIATGSKSNKFGWKGQDLKGVTGLYSLQDLQYVEDHTKDIQRAVIIGGGLIGTEMAEMLLSRNIPVTFLVREKNFWDNVLPKEEAQMIGRHIREHHVDLRLETQLKEIVDDGTGRVKGVVTDQGEEIACEFVGLTAGVSPNIDFLKGNELELDRGILVNEFLETNIPDVYAAGDCVQHRNPLANRKNVEQVWYTARIMGETAAKNLCGEKSNYQPGTWFNSAKFFDIEYQTYGWVWNELKEHEETFYWEHESGKISLRLNFDKTSKAILGVNAFGVRLRQDNFDRWIREGKTIEYVLENLASANFDPEFFRQHENEIVQQYNRLNAKALKLKAKRGLINI